MLFFALRHPRAQESNKSPLPPPLRVHISILPSAQSILGNLQKKKPPHCIRPFIHPTKPNRADKTKATSFNAWHLGLSLSFHGGRLLIEHTSCVSFSSLPLYADIRGDKIRPTSLNGSSSSSSTDTSSSHSIRTDPLEPLVVHKL